MPVDAPARAHDGRLAELRDSARGWHGVQLALLGFIGLCGVLKDEGSAAPRWLQILAGVLVLAAFALACVATYLVGRAAWPLYGLGDDGPRVEETAAVRRTSRSLTRGLGLTFVAVGLLALGAAASWWPEVRAERNQVEVQTGDLAWCGRLAEGQPGALSVVTEDRGTVQLAFADITGLRPVDAC